jgi:hypothetical protein
MFYCAYIYLFFLVLIYVVVPFIIFIYAFIQFFQPVAMDGFASFIYAR